MKEKISEIRENFKNQLKTVADAQGFEALRVHFLGKKGEVQGLFKSFGAVPKDEKPLVGQMINDLKTFIGEELNQLKDRFSSNSKTEQPDLTLPGRRISTGKKHPLTQTLDEIKRFFLNLGFVIADGPEVETDYYNFEALNLPKNHPARNMQDTLYISEEVLLRTQTSPVQIRTMQSQQPPIRMIAPGRVYRRDTPDASHSPFFHQVEGLCVDKGVSFRDLKAVIEEFAHYLFGSDINVRFRPSFFPFTEPSMEYDFSCIFCRGKGCKVCKQTGWVEIAGAGMVDPNVFTAVGYNPEIYTGYAFGMGVDRITMLRYSIDDIRLFFENDMRFLNQF